MKIFSPAFKNNQYMPAKYTCDGENISPPLVFEDIPPNCQSLVLIVDDPDAPGGVFNHWNVFNISPQTKAILENSVPDGGIEIINDYGKKSYGSPCPPSGTHRYFFKLFALDIKINIAQINSKQNILKAMENHIMEEAQIIGLYKQP